MWYQLKEIILFGEHLSNKAVILSIHYSSINCCCSLKKQLSLSQPLLPLVPLHFYSLSCDSVALQSRELVLVDAKLGNTKLLALRWISLLILLICDTNFPPLHRERVAGSERCAGEDSRREGLVSLAAGLDCRSMIRCKISSWNYEFVLGNCVAVQHMQKEEMHTETYWEAGNVGIIFTESSDFVYPVGC